MATPKQEEVLKQYLKYDSYCFLDVKKSESFIDMIKKLERPSFMIKDYSIRINEDIFPLCRIKDNDNIFICEETKDIIYSSMLRGITVKEINTISPIMHNNVDSKESFREVIFSDKTRMLLDKNDKIMPSYFEILRQNGLNSLLEIIKTLSKGYMLNEEK